MQSQSTKTPKSVLESLIFEAEKLVPIPQVGRQATDDPIAAAIQKVIDKVLTEVEDSFFFPIELFGENAEAEKVVSKIRSIANKMTLAYQAKDPADIRKYAIAQAVKNKEDSTPGVRIWRVKPKPKEEVKS